MLPLFEYHSEPDNSFRLRPYQESAMEALVSAIDAKEHPVCGLATGGGKSVLIAALCAQISGRVLVATHRKELLTQNSDTLQRFLPNADYGIYSAGLNRRDSDHRVIFGGIQSIYRRLDELQDAGPFDAVIVDECHRVPPVSTPSMYGTVLNACPSAQRVGFSATPYRLNDGPIYGGDHNWYTTLCSHIGINQLTDDGYLSPLVGTLTASDVPLDGVRTQAGEFVLSDLSQKASEESVARAAVAELCYLAEKRHSWLLFCVDVAHTELITRMIQDKGIDAASIVGTTESDERDQILEDFRARKLRVLVNCMVGTEGFDIPCVDCVALLRPTMSKSLVVQMIGRGTRLYDDKTDCLVLDMAGNLERHVPLDGIPEVKKSPLREVQDEEKERQAAIARERLARHGTKASTVDPRFMEPVPARKLEVARVTIKLTNSKKYSGKQNLMVSYMCYDDSGRRIWVNHWLCPEYSGWAREQARLWFAQRGLRLPDTVNGAYHLARSARKPTAILSGRKGGFDCLEMEYFDAVSDEDEIPF